MTLPSALTQFLASVHPYDSLPDPVLASVAEVCKAVTLTAGERVFAIGQQVEALYIIAEGEIEITDETGAQLSILGPRNSFGERALLRDGRATRTATVTDPATLIVLPADKLFQLIDAHPAVARFFDRGPSARGGGNDLGTLQVARLMTRDPVTCPPDAPIREAAAKMHDHRISSVCIGTPEQFEGIVTLRDMNARVIAKGMDASAPISDIMTADPLTLSPQALVTDVLHLMVERGIGHVPIVAEGRLLGIVTQTDLTRALAMSSADLVGRIAKATSAEAMADVTAEIPQLLVHLVDAGNRHEVITRLITDIADTATRRLLALAERALGPPPVPYLWLACGSQGRQEQTGVSDQDNCLILSDEMTEDHRPYFDALAKHVSDGLNTCGYFYCPGEMMATNPRWCQPLKVWQDYFKGWIAKPNPEAQMLASVMFDLRPIGGAFDLFDGLQRETLAAASRNSIFVAHMVSNALKHQPPLGLLRGLATIRSGEHRNELDLKHKGVVPIVDLGRIYSLLGRLQPVNTRARLEAGVAAGVVSGAGGADLLDAYDLIANLRLAHQAEQIRQGRAPGNHLDPSTLSDFERSHLRDAFVVVKTMQSAAGSGKAALG